MLKVLLLLAVLDQHTGDVLQVWNPVPGFEDMASCQKALQEAYTDMPTNGMTVIRGRCIAANELIGKEDLT